MEKYLFGVTFYLTTKISNMFIHKLRFIKNFPFPFFMLTTCPTHLLVLLSKFPHSGLSWSLSFVFGMVLHDPWPRSLPHQGAVAACFLLATVFPTCCTVYYFLMHRVWCLLALGVPVDPWVQELSVWAVLCKIPTNFPLIILKPLLIIVQAYHVARCRKTVISITVILLNWLVSIFLE